MPTHPENISPIILTDLNQVWERALHLGTPVTFVPRQLISFGDYGFYLVRKGRIRLSYISSSGQEKVLFYVGRGTLFQDVPALVGEPCVFTCMDHTSAIFFSKKVITLDFARTYPDLMLNWVESTARKSQNFFSQLCGSGLMDSFANVCRALYSMAVHNRQGDTIVPQLTRLELASLLSIHRDSLHRALTRLKSEGIIGGYSRHELIVLDLERLQHYAFG